MSRLWDKGGALDRLVHRFTVGDDPIHDARLVRHDAVASAAHARMLAAQGYLSAGDATRLAEALDEIAASHDRGEWTISPEEEDCHTALENRLVARLGELGKRIHLGRSRNDQVLAALRLMLRHEVEVLAAGARSVADGLDALGARHRDLPIPGYTHTQRAMPSSVALWAGGFASAIRDDAEGLEACRRRLSCSPLGSAAGYGTPGLALDPALTARELGFASVQSPVTAVQISRGKAEAEVVFALALLAQDLGRLAADLVLYATSEFALVELPDAFTTGSSIMPQKRNPDVFELLRARSAELPGNLVQILGITGKLGSGYHRDLQLLKAPLFRSLDAARDMLAVTDRALPGIRFREARCRSLAADPALHATERAFRLVADHGLAFRDAYRQVAEELARDRAAEAPSPAEDPAPPEPDRSTRPSRRRPRPGRRT